METFTFLLTSTFYSGPGVGGDANHVKWLAEELTKMGHQVHVLYSQDAHNFKNKPVSTEPNDVQLHAIKTPLNASPYIAYTIGKCSSVDNEFNELIKSIRPNIVHHHNMSLLGYGILPKRSNYVNVYTAHDFWLICQQNNMLKPNGNVCRDFQCFKCSLKLKKPFQFWRATNKFKDAIQGFDMVISPRKYLAEHLSNALKNEILCIPNFVPDPPVRIEGSSFTNFFLYAGVLEKHKGILELIHVFRQISTKLNQILVIAGDGSLRREIEEYIKAKNLQEKIFLVGWANHDLLYRLLNDADALVMPSICPENCPLIILEALSVGTPVIASDRGGLPEIVQKVDINLVYNSPVELEHILMTFDKSKRQSYDTKTVYQKHFCRNAYLHEYFKNIERLQGIDS